MVHPKGQPNLVNDPVYRPDWKERTLSHERPPERMTRLGVRVTGEFLILLNRAARRRGISNSAYVRRAVSAFIAQELQMPFEDVCATSPGVEHVKFTNKGVVWPRDDGRGYGKWEVVP